MLKRIFAGILTLALTVLTLSGCSFFSYDEERAMQQQIAVVKSYNITNTVLDENGESKEYNYSTQKKTIYKRDLLEYVQSNSSTLSNSFSGDAEGLYKYAARMLVSTELVTNEVDALIASGQVDWGVEQENTVRQNLYTTIDNTIALLKNNVLDERGMEQITTPSDSDTSESTTYPVKPDATDDDDDEYNADVKVDPEPWAPDRTMWPGINGDIDARSLEREAMKRFIALIKSRVKDDFRLDKPERKWLKTKINNELKAIDELIDTKGIEYVYPEIGNYSYPMREYDGKFGFIMYFLSGESLERSQKITAMQNYLIDSVTVKYEEVAESFRTTLGEQRSNYTKDETQYESAVNGGSTTVLYHANSNFFYVKHILLPFSDEQKADLDKYKNSVKNLQEDEQEAKINEYREWLAESIVCYPHKDGEDDKTKPMSVDQVLSHIRSVMTPLASSNSVKRANDAFNDLIYLYNTDPGAFGNDKGYVVKYKLGEDEGETYMQEFADAARYMRDNLEVGRFYDHKVITNYGVHIMYLSSVPKLGEVSLSDYTTPDESQTYYDVFEEPIRSSRESAAFTDWQNNILAYNYKKYSKTYTDNFSDLWEK